jgi:hypothetical protein
LEIPQLATLWVTIAMIENPSYDLITRTCKRYDKAMDKTKKAEQEEINLMNQAGFGKDKQNDVMICSYKSCGKPGHTQDNCWVKKKDQRIAKNKRGDRKIDRSARGGKRKDRDEDDDGDDDDDDDDDDRFKRNNQRNAHCYCCGGADHKSYECPDRVMDPKDSKTKKANGGRKRNDWNKFVRKGERDDEVDMFFEDDFDDNAVLLTDVSGLVFLDSCASKRLFIVQD